MPELPEVQTLVDELQESGILGLTILETRISWPKTIATSSPKQFTSTLSGKKILKVSRRAKFIIFELDHDFALLVHLRMTGRLKLLNKNSPHSPYERAALLFKNGLELRFEDTRKFGRIYLVPSLAEFFKEHGPEPLDLSFTWLDFKDRLLKKHAQLKPLLLNQRFLAGLGNIYVDEALWLAKLHPLRKSDSLADSEIKALLQSIRDVLHIGLKSSGTTLGSGKTNFYRMDGSKGTNSTELNVFRRTKKPCKRCGAPIIRIKVGMRSTHLCLHCQI